MVTRVLVAYATKYGSTAEIAERIGEVLNQAGLSVEVLPAKRVDELASYDAVVLGSAVYMFRWRRPAARLLKRNRRLLAQKLVWLFSSGPTEEGDPFEIAEGWTLPKGLQAVADEIGPVDVMLFGGALDLERMKGFDRWVMSKFDAPTGDFRDWGSVTAWAHGVAYRLQKMGPE